MSESPLITYEAPGLTPPNALESERSVLGALMQDGGALIEAMEALEAEDFYHPQHQQIFGAIKNLFVQGRAVDLTTVSSELIRLGQFEFAGGGRYLVELLEDTPSTAHCKFYVDIVLEKSTLRKLIAAARGISDSAYSQKEPLENILTGAEKAIFDIVMKRTGGDSLKPIREVLQTTYAQIEALERNRGQISGVPTGFPGLDISTTGLHGGELIIIGARPSMGKTSFAINLATHAAHKGKTIAVFSLEMPREQIALRMLCADAKVNMQRVRQGLLSANDWQRLADALVPLASTHVYIDDAASLTPTQLRSRCRRLMMDDGLDLVVIDYLQLMSGDGKVENRQLEVSEISRRLKSIALELKIPIIACAQLSRANVQRGNKKPVLSDLRDSGSIEQDADIVMFLHRDLYYTDGEEPQAESNGADLIIAKQRNGPLGTIKLNWLEEYTLFEERLEGDDDAAG